MNCMEARRMVTPFVKKELSPKDTEAFLNHVESCEDCMDELDIYYIAYHASDLLDSGEKHEYDFEKMLREEIRSAKRGISRRKFSSYVRMGIVTVSEILLLVCLLFGISIRTGRSDSPLFQRFFLSGSLQDRTGSEKEDQPAAATEKEKESYETENRTD